MKKSNKLVIFPFNHIIISALKMLIIILNFAEISGGFIFTTSHSNPQNFSEDIRDIEYLGEMCQYGVKRYHKRLLWLIDFSREEAPTWPRSRGRLGMIHPEGHSTVRETLTPAVIVLHTYMYVQTHAVPQQGPGIS